MITRILSISLMLLTLFSMKIHAEEKMIDIGLQKVALEENLIQRYEKGIASIISREHFVVTVDVETKKDDIAPDAITAKDKDPNKIGDNFLMIDKFDLVADLTKLDSRSSAVGIFDLIKSVKVSVLLSNEVNPEKIGLIKNVIGKISFAVGGVTPEIIYGNFEIPHTSPKEKWLEIFNKYSHLILGLLAIVVIVIVMLVVSSRFTKVGTGLANTLKETFAKQEETGSSGYGDQSPGQALGASLNASITGNVVAESEEEEGFPGLDRFKAMLVKTPDQAVLYVNRWVASRSEGVSDALSFLIKKLSAEDLSSLLGMLSPETRLGWKRLLKPMKDSDLKRGDLFINREVMEGLMSPPPKMKDHLMKMLGSISPSECAELVRKDVELGAILINLLPMSFTTKVFEIIEDSYSKDLAEMALRYDADLFEKKQDELAALLESGHAVARSSSSGFVDKIVNLIPRASVQKESYLFDALAKTGEIEALRFCAISNFPTELTNRLPGDLFKRIFLLLPSKKRIDFLLSRSDEDRLFYLSHLGDQKTKVREMLDIDIALVMKNDVEVKKIEKNRDNISKSFIEFTRAFIQKDKAAFAEVERIVNGWVNEKSGGQSAENVISIEKGAA